MVDNFQTNTICFYAIQEVSVQYFMVDSKTEPVVEFQRQVKVANGAAKTIIIMLYNYSTHHADQVKATARKLDIDLVYFPPIRQISIH